MDRGGRFPALTEKVEGLNNSQVAPMSHAHFSVVYSQQDSAADYRSLTNTTLSGPC